MGDKTLCEGAVVFSDWHVHVRILGEDFEKLEHVKILLRTSRPALACGEAHVIEECASLPGVVVAETVTGPGRPCCQRAAKKPLEVNGDIELAGAQLRN